MEFFPLHLMPVIQNLAVRRKCAMQFSYKKSMLQDSGTHSGYKLHCPTGDKHIALILGSPRNLTDLPMNISSLLAAIKNDN